MDSPSTSSYSSPSSYELLNDKKCSVATADEKTNLISNEAQISSPTRNEEIVSSATKVYGGRFSKSPDEREKMLLGRKELLMNSARKCFLAKKHTSPQTTVSQDEESLPE
jgi:hypothetical protein